MRKVAAQTKKEVQSISFRDGISTITIGDTKIEVNADGKKVTAYTKNGVGVEVKAAAVATEAEEGTKISISKDFNAVVLNGVTIEQAADGHLVITAPDGTVINKSAPANDAAIKAAKGGLEIGDKMPDGTVYAGISPTTGKEMFALPLDESLPSSCWNKKYLTMSWRSAMKIAKEKNTHGHKDYRVPTAEELAVLCQNKDRGFLRNTFKKGLYWSSSKHNEAYVESRSFNDGSRCSTYEAYTDLSVRLVRG